MIAAVGDSLDHLFDANIKVDPKIEVADKAAFVLEQLKPHLPASLIESINCMTLSVVCSHAHHAMMSVVRSSVEAVLLSESKSASSASASSSPPLRKHSPSPSPPTSATRNPFRFFGLSFSQDGRRALTDAVNALPLTRRISDYSNTTPVDKPSGPHVTIVFFGRSKEPENPADVPLMEYASKNLRRGFTITVTHVVQNASACAAVVQIPGELRRPDPSHVPHITLALNGDTSAVYSNTMLRATLGGIGSEADRGEVFQLPQPLALSTVLEGMW